MKTILKMAVATVAAGLCLGDFNARADLEIGASVQIHARTDFEAPLAARGSWISVGSHGRCWRPRGIATGWRPYGEGHWVWTDAGWYWDTDEPWGWACYHYGTWFNDPNSGWVWVPGTQWAPAWVQWRTGGGYIGWAPCAPAGVAIRASSYGFVGVGHFSDRQRPEGLIVNNTEIMRKTTRMAAAKTESRTIGGTKRSVVFNHGPDVAMIQKSTGTKITRVPIQQAARRTTSAAAASIHPHGPAAERKPTAERKPAETPAARGAAPERRTPSEPASQAEKPVQRESRPEKTVPNEHTIPNERGTPATKTPAKVAPKAPASERPAKTPEQPPRVPEKVPEKGPEKDKP